jgi:hypothetical protein
MPDSIALYEEGYLRYEDDTPVVIPSLKRALEIFSEGVTNRYAPLEDGTDQYAFQKLIFFFSSLYRTPSEEQVHDLSDQLVMRYWKLDQANLDHIENFWERDTKTNSRVDSVINQLDAVSTFREVN